MLASELFNNKKDSYEKSIERPFKSDRLNDCEAFKSMPKVKQDIIKNKAYIQDSNEKEIVISILFN